MRGRIRATNTNSALLDRLEIIESRSDGLASYGITRIATQRRAAFIAVNRTDDTLLRWWPQVGLRD
jgi:hypothetical protein